METFTKPSYRVPGQDDGPELQLRAAQPGDVIVSRDILLTAERLLRLAAADVADFNPCWARSFTAAARDLYAGAHR